MKQYFFFKDLVSKFSYILSAVCMFPFLGSSDGVIDLVPFEVTGSRIPDEGFRSDVDLLTINSDDLSISNPESLWETLETVSGLHVEQPAGFGGNASVYLRGGEPNSAKVLIDGIDVGNNNDIRGGTYNFNAVSIDTVDQISILTGSRSAIHGSDALSGVINISTIPADWKNQSSAGSATLRLGDGGLFDSSISQGLALQNTYLSASTSYTREDSWIEGSDFEAKRINLGMATTAGPNTTVQVTGFGSWLERSHLPDDSGGPLYAVWKESDQRETDQFGTSLKTSTSIQPDLILKTHAYYYRFDEYVDSPGVAPGDRDPFGVPPNSIDNSLERYQISSYLVHSPADKLSLVYGFTFLNEKGDSQSSVTYPFATIDGGYSQKVSTLSGFLESGYQLRDNMLINAALRYDDIEDLDQVWTSRLAYSVEIPDTNTELQISWGNGFKKPSFFALGNPVIGNPDLLPEESDLYEVSLSTWLPAKRIRITNSIFRQEYTNLIDFSEAPPPRMINLNEVVSRGANSRLHFVVSDDTSLALDVTYLDMEVIDSDELLRNRPEWKFGLTFNHQVAEKWHLSLRGLYISSRLDSSIPTGTMELDSFFRLDAGLTCDVTNFLSVSLAVDNLLDENYEELIGFVSPGIRLRSRLSLRW